MELSAIVTPVAEGGYIAFNPEESTGSYGTVSGKISPDSVRAFFADNISSDGTCLNYPLFLDLKSFALCNLFPHFPV